MGAFLLRRVALAVFVVFVVTLLFSPETKGKELVPELTLVESPV